MFKINHCHASMKQVFRRITIFILEILFPIPGQTFKWVAELISSYYTLTKKSVNEPGESMLMVLHWKLLVQWTRKAKHVITWLSWQCNSSSEQGVFSMSCIISLLFKTCKCSLKSTRILPIQASNVFSSSVQGGKCQKLIG